MPGPTIALEHLTFRYRTRQAPAVRDVHLTIQAGETLVVLGPSGSGKSTLAYCLNGLIPHHIPGEMAGSVRIDGQDTRALEPAELAQTVGVVFQNPEAQFCLLKVEDEVAFGLENLGVPRAQMQPRVDAALAAVGLGGRGAAPIERLSGGEQQRLALATALVMDPRALVFDEPTANLDAVAAAEFFERVRRLRGRHTMVIVEHRVEHVLPLADRVLVLGPDGSPAALGAPREVLRDHWRELIAAGVWLPEVAEVALRRGATEVPLTVDEAAGLFAGWRPAAPATSSLPRAGGEPAAVQVQGLTFAYSGHEPVLKDVVFAVPEGRLTAIVGPNGSGKTTLVSHLAGILEPPQGTVAVFGTDGRALARRPDPRLIGFVFQNPEHQFLTQRVFDEVAWGLRRLRVPETDVRERVRAELVGLGLWHLADVTPYKLSGGEQRRLSLATALVLGPRLLVCDEPTFGQDRATSAALADRLRDLLQAGTTIVVVTHDARLVAQEADHVVLLVDGRVAFEGTPARLLADRELLRAGRLRRPPLLDLAERLGCGEAPPLGLAAVDGWLASDAAPAAPREVAVG